MSEIKVDTLTGKTTANDITVTVGATVTAKLEQGLAKVWARYDQTNTTNRDSFNTSSISDQGTGIFGLNYSNIFNNIYYATTGSGNQNRRFQINGTGESEQATNLVFCRITTEATTVSDITVIGVHITGDLA